MPAAKEAPRAARWWVEGCGAVCGALRGARKCGCGGHLRLQGWCRAMGMGCVYVWLANAARAGVPLALLGARGGWRLRARGGVHLHGSRGGALGGGSSQLPPWWPLQSRSEHAERAAPPPKCEHQRKKSFRQSLKPVQTTTPLSGGDGPVLKNCRQLFLQLGYGASACTN